MMKKLIVAAAVLAAVALPQSSPAESVCADAGASNPLRRIVTVPQPGGITTPTVCIWIP
jgi:hypothetical protein